MLTRRQFGLASASLVAAPTLLKAQPNQKIMLGQSAAFSGPAAELGIQFNHGARLWFDQVNAQGGVSGKLIEIKALDDGYEPDRCAENTRKLIAEDVQALFGYIGTPTSLAALPILTKAQMPFIAPFTGAVALREPFNRLVFHLRASYDDETALIVNQLVHLGLKKVAVFYQNDAYGLSGLSGVTRALERHNLKAVAQATVERNSADVEAAVKTLVAAAPDAIVQISAYKSCAACIKAARKSGFGGTFYNVSFVGTQALADELGGAGAGVVVSQVVPTPYSPVRAIAREFAEAVKKTGAKVQTNFSSMEGYLSAKLLTEGLKRAGARAASREGLIQGLESIGKHDFGGFQVDISAKDHVASSFVELSMLTGDGRVRT